MNSIAIIIPYFGRLPFWSDLFFLSCQHNSTVDFHFFTDCDLARYNAPNIHVTAITFSDYCNTVSTALGIDFHPANPYKLCDIKPFFGLIHRVMLEEEKYDFWGFGDLDLVWGNLREFYTTEILSRYDIISNHSDRLSGHLCLLRNTDKYNHLCLKIPGWESLLSDQKNHALDEQALTLTVWPAVHWLWKLHTKVFFRLPLQNEWQTYVRLCTRIGGYLGRPGNVLFRESFTTPFTDDLQDDTAAWRYADGSVTDLRNGRELPYLHFLCLKHKWGGAK